MNVPDSYAAYLAALHKLAISAAVSSMAILIKTRPYWLILQYNADLECCGKTQTSIARRRQIVKHFQLFLSFQC